jgi:hypothetical protein
LTFNEIKADRVASVSIELGSVVGPRNLYVAVVVESAHVRPVFEKSIERNGVAIKAVWTSVLDRGRVRGELRVGVVPAARRGNTNGASEIALHVLYAGW